MRLPPQPRGSRGSGFGAWLTWPAAAVLLALAAACSSSGPSRQAVTIPLPGAGASESEQALGAYYRNVLEQMRAAYKGRDLPQLRSLLQQHQRDDLPDYISSALDRYAVLAGGLAFEEAVSQNSRIAAIEPLRPLSDPQPYRCEIRAPKDLPPVSLGGGSETNQVRLVCFARVEDIGAMGNVRERRSSLYLPVKASHELTVDAPLVLPFAVPESGPDVAMRRVHLTVELMPCRVDVDGRETPVRRTLCCRHVAMAYPPNHEHIREAPLKTLQEALRRGSAKYDRHVLLAAHFMPADKKQQALELLMRKLRVGSQGQARVAMTALRELTGEDFPVTDRQRWLSWWEARKAHPEQKGK